MAWDDNKHVDSGFACLMGHGDGVQCIRCARCNRFMRPWEMDQECDGTIQREDADTVENYLMTRSAKELIRGSK